MKNIRNEVARFQCSTVISAGAIIVAGFLFGTASGLAQTVPPGSGNGGSRTLSNVNWN